MTDAERKQDSIEAQRLIDRVTGTISRNTDRTVAGLGLIQANLAQAAVSALVQLLIRKNIVSASEVDTFLASAYRARADQLHDSGLVVPAAPQVNLNGGLK